MPGDPGTAPLRRDRHRSDRPGGDRLKGGNTPEVAARFAQLNGIHRDEVDLDEANASVQTGAVLSHPRVLKKRKIPPARWAKPAKNPGKKTRPPPHQEPTPRTHTNKPDPKPQGHMVNGTTKVGRDLSRPSTGQSRTRIPQEKPSRHPTEFRPNRARTSLPRQRDGRLKSHRTNANSIDRGPRLSAA